MNANEERNKVIWRFSDGRPGHDAQSEGLISSLSRLFDCECLDIRVPVPFNTYVAGLFKKFPLAAALPDPDLLIGAGHATHLPMLLARHARKGLALVLMKPGLPTALFDFCLIPEHDKPKYANNIITTRGPLNLLRPSQHLSSEQGLILVGGVSKHFFWDGNRLQEQLRFILEKSNIRWTITDSPRTPHSTRKFLRGLNTQDVNYLPYSDENRSLLLEQLEKAGTVWVSQDSMSMMFEAMSTGAAIGILEVPAKDGSKLAVVADDLAAQGHVTLYEDWLTRQTLMRPDKPLYESARCAIELARRLNWASDKII